MDAMGLTFKKLHTVSTSLSGSFNHNPAESPKFPGIVSTAPLQLLPKAASFGPSASRSSLLEFIPPLTCLLH